MKELLPLLVPLGGFSLVILLMRVWIGGVMEKLDGMGRMHHECRETLPDRFARRGEIEELYRRTNDHGERLRYLEGLRNGARGNGTGSGGRPS